MLRTQVTGPGTHWVGVFHAFLQVLDAKDGKIYGRGKVQPAYSCDLL